MYLFFLSVVVLTIAPGPIMFYLLAQSLEQGRIAGLFSVLGICVGDCIHTLLAASGLYVLLTTSPATYTLIKYLGAAYLIYLGINSFWSSRARKNTVLKQNKLTSAFTQGLLTCLLNPYSFTFFLTFIPQFLDTHQESIAEQILMMSSIWISVNLIWHGLLVVVASAIAQSFHLRPRCIKFQHWLAGTILISIGVRFVLPFG
jgi:threonine/homoserine/homoserine lactone efflux protein